MNLKRNKSCSEGNLPTTQETQLRSLGQEDLLEKGMATTPVFLSGEFHGQRSLADNSPWGSQESDLNEQLTYMYN